MSGALKPTMHVVAGALLSHDGQILIAQRPPGKHLAGAWEFPGGKLAQGETSLADIEGAQGTATHQRIVHEKSEAQIRLCANGGCSGCLMRVGMRCLVRLGKFSFIAQYTRCTRLWLKPWPWMRSRSNHFQKPRRLCTVTTAFNAAITSASCFIRHDPRR